MSEYVDIRDIHPTYEWQECWNCDNRKRIRTDRPPWRVCKGCFMGQVPVDEDLQTDITTPEGYTDYRLLWYGDVSIAEAKRRYRETTEEITERHRRRDASDRAVRL